jgi:aminoglycoside 6'-N-acetyltransferase
VLVLRPATLADVPTLKAWDQNPHVISATTDDPDADNAFEGIVWEEEIETSSDVSRYYVAERDGRPIGAMQIIDPHLEPTHYWGDVAPNLRAVDIWIGETSDLGQGHGEEMMRQALALCFADPAVTAVIIDPLASNTRAHKFYQRIGFKPLDRRLFNDEDDCLVHELTRADWRRHFGAPETR